MVLDIHIWMMIIIQNCQTLDALEAGAPEALVDEYSRTVKAGLHDDQRLLYPGLQAQYEATRAALTR